MCSNYIPYFDFYGSKSMRLPAERVELIQKLSKESDIYERLARAIGKLPINVLY